MTLKRDETKDWPDARKIALGGEEFVVAPLTLRQTIELAGVSKKIFASRETGLTRVSDERAIYGPEMLDDYIDVIRIGLKRAYPDVTRDDVLDLTGSTSDLIAASTVVFEQSGGKRDASSGEEIQGEQTAASGSTSSTGQGSSPTSA